MTTFRDRLLADGIDYVPGDLSSLDQWFASFIDISFYEMEVKDVARSIRQDLFLSDMLPLAEVYLREDPLAGLDRSSLDSTTVLNIEKLSKIS